MNTHGFQTGDRVRCEDGETGTVLEMIDALRHGAQQLLIQWDNGTRGDCDSWCLDRIESPTGVVGYNDRGDPVRRAPLGRVQSEDDQ